MNKIKRYAIDIIPKGETVRIGIIDDPEGNWVMSTDYQAEVDRLEAELGRQVAINMELVNKMVNLQSIKVILSSPTSTDPFRRFDCEVIDVGHADRYLMITCREMQSELEAAMVQIKRLQEKYFEKMNGERIVERPHSVEDK